MKHIYFLLLVFVSGIAIGNAQDTSGETVFDESIVHEIHITFSEPDFWDILTENYNNAQGETDPWTGEVISPPGDKVYLEATVLIDGNDGGTVGIRQKGFFSNWGAFDSTKKPLKIDFNEFVPGHKYDGLKKLNLQNGFSDPSMMRDVLAYKLFREAGIPAPRTAYAKVYLNNTYWGLYIMVEQINKTFLKENFSDNDGNLFKCIDNTDLEWQGNDLESYTDEFELKTNEEENDWTDFIDFVDVVNNSDEDDFKTDLEAEFMLDDYLKTLALDVMIQNWDSYYDHGRNFYIYHNPDEDKFQWIPWDYNLSFSSSEADLLLTNVGQGGWPGEEPSEKPLTKNIFANETLKQQYLQHVCDLKNEYFTLENLEAFIDQTAATIEEALEEDTNKFFSMAEFQSGLDAGNAEYPGLKSFITNRAEEIADEFDGLSFDCFGLGEEELFVNEAFQLYPNPVSDQLHIVVAGEDAGQVEIYNSMGAIVYAKHAVAGDFQINTSGFHTGLYHVQFRQGDTLLSKKLIVQ